MTLSRTTRFAQEASTCATLDGTKSGNLVFRYAETQAMIALRRKMATPEAQQKYRRRSRVIEFCHAWIKSKLGLRQFHLRGLAKVQTEMLWACLTYNFQQWIRLRKLQAAPATT